jgi:hypothetical protein
VLAATVLSAVALFLVATSLLQRTGSRSVLIDPAGPMTLISNAGPVEVVPSSPAAGDRFGFDYLADWLVAGPVLTAASATGTVDLRCDDRWPCRAAATVAMPRARALTVQADHDVLVGPVDGDLAIVGRGEARVLLGSVAGTVSTNTEAGAVLGYRIRVSQLDVRTVEGPVELTFAAVPERVEVTAGAEPVTIELPVGTYAVSVESPVDIQGEPLDVHVDVETGETTDADGTVVVRSSGPVRITNGQAVLEP